MRRKAAQPKHPTVEEEHRAYAKRVTEERRNRERTANRTLLVTTVTLFFTVIGILVGVLIRGREHLYSRR
jgi:hypothetical protein